MSAVNEICKQIERMAYQRNTWEIWCDFLQLAATSIANAVDKRPEVWQAREAAYLQTAKRYNAKEIEQFSHLLGKVVDALTVCPGDVLGQAYMQLELGNKWHGQFFTPDSLCRTMASMIYGDQVKQRIEQNGFVTVSEPSCGGGATIISLADVIKKKGVNYQQTMHVTAVDIDIKSVHMCYIQCALLHIPAVIIHGNTLSLEEWSHWYTPAHILDGWSMKLKARKNTTPPPPLKIYEPISTESQITLF